MVGVDLERESARSVPGLRPLRTTIRAAHVVAVAAFFGGHVYAVSSERLEPAVAAVVATGVAFTILEIVRAPVWVVQVRGLAVYAKVALMAAVSTGAPAPVLLLTLALVVGVVASHMPGRYRYYSLVHRRVVGHQDKG
ncbi:MAG: hypothetical protein ABFS41_02205 [Myxococcota bacterium]